MYTYDSVFPQHASAEPIQGHYSNDEAMPAFIDNEPTHLPKYEQFCYPQTPQPACKTPQKVYEKMC